MDIGRRGEALTARSGSSGWGKILSLCILLTVAVAVAASIERTGNEVGPAERGWLAPLAAAERALDRGDLQEAVRFAQAARTAAIQSRSWEAYAHTADVFLRIGAITSERHPWVEEARRLHHRALFRARADGSVAGVLRAGDAMVVPRPGPSSATAEAPGVAHDDARFPA